MKIAILTSSRADFGIYLPLLHHLNRYHQDIKTDIIVFGTHLSHFHGYTICGIKEAGFKIAFEIPSMLITDNPESISSSYALTTLKFSTFWANQKNQFDWVLCLGDRFEMAAAVAAGIPFGIPFAHIGGGETTLGAIDNIYRHSISLSSKLHFVSHREFAKKVEILTGSKNIVISGSLALENLKSIKILSKEDFKKRWSINPDDKIVLVTVHPETIMPELNLKYCKEMVKALGSLSLIRTIVITMPNADTNGNIYRNAFKKLAEGNSKVHIIENFGTESYFSTMYYADLLIGNTSSGIVEAASFSKYVINVGDRQKGRLAGKNVIHVPFDHTLICNAVDNIGSKKFKGKNIFQKSDTIQIIIDALKNHGINHA
jgi:GDP/UDP-N,N'-diacetylbacillosamine 2-epimerase (hydrolysing)